MIAVRPLVLLLSLLFCWGCRSVELIRYGLAGRDVNQISLFGSEQVDFNQLDKVELKGFRISDFENPRVKKFIRHYQTTSKKQVHSILKQGRHYLPMIKRLFREKNIPEDLIYLPIVESGFRIRARSPKKALGLWQFMYATGKHYGLDNSYWHEDRLDPIKSTRAAAYHLRHLYKQFGDWLLVLAAYNAGTGKIKRAIQLHGTRDFWKMSEGHYLRRETKDYIPKFIAATLIAKNPDVYGFHITEERNEPELIAFSVEDATEIAILARCAGLPETAFKAVNPALLRWATPPSRPFDIYLPKHCLSRFVDHFQNIRPEERVTYRRHFVRVGDNLTLIAKKFSVPKGPIAEINKLASLNQIRAGEVIFIPIKGLVNARRVDEQKQKKSASRSYSYVFLHEVSRDDTLYAIARRYRVALIDLFRWNHLTNFQSIHPGMLLVIKE